MAIFNSYVSHYQRVVDVVGYGLEPKAWSVLIIQFLGINGFEAPLILNQSVFLINMHHLGLKQFNNVLLDSKKRCFLSPCKWLKTWYPQHLADYKTTFSWCPRSPFQGAMGPRHFSTSCWPPPGPSGRRIPDSHGQCHGLAARFPNKNWE